MGTFQIFPKFINMSAIIITAFDSVLMKTWPTDLFKATK